MKQAVAELAQYGAGAVTTTFAAFEDLLDFFLLAASAGDAATAIATAAARASDKWIFIGRPFGFEPRFKARGKHWFPGIFIETGSGDYALKNLVKAIMLHRSVKRESFRLWHICQPGIPAHLLPGRREEITAPFSKIPEVTDSGAS